MIYKENDKEFSLNISLSRTKKYLFLNVSKTESNETWFLDLEKEDFNLKCFTKRMNKHLYYVDDTPESFFILSNRNNQENFALYETNFFKTAENDWKLLIAHKKNVLIENFLCFKDFIILEIRKNGLAQLIQINRKNFKKTHVDFKDETFSVNLTNNINYNAPFFSYVFTSLKQPASIYSQNLYTKKKKTMESKSFKT